MTQPRFVLWKKNGVRLWTKFTKVQLSADYVTIQLFHLNLVIWNAGMEVLKSLRLNLLTNRHCLYCLALRPYVLLKTFAFSFDNEFKKYWKFWFYPLIGESDCDVITSNFIYKPMCDGLKGQKHVTTNYLITASQTKICHSRRKCHICTTLTTKHVLSLFLPTSS